MSASSLTLRTASSSPNRSASPASVDERQPLLPRSSEASPTDVMHWDRDHVGDHFCSLNRPHYWVRHRVPRMLQPERAVQTSASVPPFARTQDDSARGAAIAASTQVLLGTFFAAGAVDAFAAMGPSFTNPSGHFNPVLGFSFAVASSLGFSFAGAALGNMWYHALLTMSARNHVAIARHRSAAETTAVACSVATIVACMFGSALAGADFLKRMHEAPPDGPAPNNAVYEYTLAAVALTVAPIIGGCSNWYLGRLLGAAVSNALDGNSDSGLGTDLFNHDQTPGSSSQLEEA